jgi:3-oxoacyl-(acyl-carrier-protein) synthase
VELVAATLAMHREMVPPTLGTAHVDPALGKRRVALEPEPSRRDGALLLSQSLGGRCAALAVGIAA